MELLKENKNQEAISITVDNEASKIAYDNKPILTQLYPFYNIPAELRELKQWVVHKAKIPYNVHSGQPDKNNPEEWASFEEALAVVHDYDGIGFRFNNNGIIGIDIDTCIDPITGKLSDEAAYIIKTLDSYTELSPSGYGVHIFIFVDSNVQLPFNKKLMKANGIVRACINLETREPILDNLGNVKYKTPEIEFYNDGRYFTMTGHVYGEYKTIANREQELLKVLELFQDKANNNQNNQCFLKLEPINNINNINNHVVSISKSPELSINLTEEEVLKIMFGSKNQEKYKALFNGDTSNYGFDDSRADQALCNILCFYTQGNIPLMDSLFRKSSLMRPKWDEKRGAETYGVITINKALSYVAEYYNPQKGIAEANFDLELIWEDPIPFNTIQLPDFPIDCLPDKLKNYVEAVAESTQTPLDMAGVACLSVIATCVHGKYKIQGKPDWIEPLNLYSVIVANPAERKSAIMSLMTKYIEEYEYDTNEVLKPKIQTNETERRMLNKEIDTLINSGANKKGNDAGFIDVKVQIAEKQEILNNLPEVKPLRLLADDVSAEALTSLLADNKGKMAVISSEGGIFEVLNGRYSQSINIDTFLKAHIGDNIRVDRKGRASELIKNPCLTVLLSIQPQVLEGMMSNDEFRGRGLTARFLYSMPKSKVGSRKFETNPISEEVKNKYRDLCLRLLNITQSDQPEILVLSGEAYKLTAQFAKDLEYRLIDDLEGMADFAGKLHGAILRIAGILHLSSDSIDEKVVSAGTMRNAIQLGFYFLEHAKAAYQKMGANSQLEEAKYILKQLKKDCEHNSCKDMTRYEILRICNRYSKVEDMSSALALLVEYNYLKQIEPKQNPNKLGRPFNSRFILNPKFLGY